MFHKVDVLATPTSPCLPFKFGERLDDPVQMYMADFCTVFVNLAGTAGISLPNGFGERDGVRLPTGLQLVCAPFRDPMLLRVAHQYEQLTGWRYTPPAWVTRALAGLKWNKCRSASVCRASFCCAIIPAYNEEARVGNVARLAVRSGLFAEVVVVDDGSTDGTDNAARMTGAHVLTHTRNKGKAAAMLTGLQAHAAARSCVSSMPTCCM